MRRLFHTFVLLLTAILSTPSARTAEITEGLIIQDDIAIVRFYLNDSLYQNITELGLKTHLQTSILETAKGRLGRELPGKSHHYFVAIIKNNALWCMEIGPQNAPYRVYSGRLADGGVGYFSWTGKALQNRAVMKRWPVAYSRVTSHFNPRRRHPITGAIRPHRGIDLKARTGTPVYAPADGVVEYARSLSGYGRTVKLNHAKGYDTLYAHLSRYAKGLRAGQSVNKGQLIAYVGNTGMSTGPHLHYEIHVNGVAKDPATVRLLNEPPTLSGKALELFNQDKLIQKAALAAASRIVGG